MIKNDIFNSKLAESIKPIEVKFFKHKSGKIYKAVRFVDEYAEPPRSNWNCSTLIGECEHFDVFEKPFNTNSFFNFFGFDKYLNENNLSIEEGIENHLKVLYDLIEKFKKENFIYGIIYDSDFDNIGYIDLDIKDLYITEYRIFIKDHRYFNNNLMLSGLGYINLEKAEQEGLRLDTLKDRFETELQVLENFLLGDVYVLELSVLTDKGWELLDSIGNFYDISDADFYENIDTVFGSSIFYELNEMTDSEKELVNEKFNLLESKDFIIDEFCK